MSLTMNTIAAITLSLAMPTAIGGQQGVEGDPADYAREVIHMAREIAVVETGIKFGFPRMRTNDYLDTESRENRQKVRDLPKTISEFRKLLGYHKQIKVSRDPEYKKVIAAEIEDCNLAHARYLSDMANHYTTSNIPGGYHGRIFQASRVKFWCAQAR